VRPVTGPGIARPEGDGVLWDGQRKFLRVLGL